MRGYIVVAHGGGAACITQTNDTDLHQHQRRLYIDQEYAEMCRFARINPGKSPSAMVEQCIDWMSEARSRRALHVQAWKGFKYTGATNALDGSEDHLIGREARLFWDKLESSAKRNAACHDVRVEVEAGRLRSGYDDVYSLVAPFPLRGELDKMVVNQDDENVAFVEDEEAWSDEEDDDWDDNEDDREGEDAGAEAGAEGEFHALRAGGVRTTREPKARSTLSAMVAQR